MGDRRKSMAPRTSMRPQSRPRLSMQQQDDMLKLFFQRQGLTIEDLNAAFEILSHDGRKITGQDIRSFANKYFDKIPADAESWMNMKPKEEMTRDQLLTLLFKKELQYTPFDDAFEWFQPQGGFVSKNVLKKLASATTPLGTPNKADVPSILTKFDRDRDGNLNMDDFMKMSI
ncbi:hypothetical protein EDD86DRAFT_256256 [Gorgonomyces haynaldii]|nr:hypothetical protein EDD86DRAFT_256256 [Gorgonomyces haynaldii]